MDCHQARQQKNETDYHWLEVQDQMEGRDFMLGLS